MGWAIVCKGKWDSCCSGRASALENLNINVQMYRLCATSQDHKFRIYYTTKRGLNYCCFLFSFWRNGLTLVSNAGFELCIYMVLGIELRALCMLHSHSNNWATSLASTLPLIKKNCLCVVHMPMCARAEARGRCQVFCSITLLYPLRQALSLNSELGWACPKLHVEIT